MKLTAEQWELVVANRHRVAKYTHRYWRGNGDWDEVEDAAMWGLIRAAEKSDGVRDFEAFSGCWMDRSARSAATRRRGTVSHADLSSVPDESRDRHAAYCLADLSGYWDRLLPRQRQVAELRYGRGLSISRIADEVGATRASVTKTIVRAAERLRRLVGAEPLCKRPLRRSPMNQEPAGFEVGTGLFVIRFGDAPPMFLSSMGWPNLVLMTDYARKFTTPADAVCHIEGLGIPRLIDDGPGVPIPAVVPERDPSRVVWPPAGGPDPTQV